MPIAGFVRNRAHQFGRQSALGTAVAAKRRVPLTGTPDVNLNWTDPDNDSGSLFPVASPVRGISDLGASLTANALYYNELPRALSGIFGGGVTPTGAGTDKTWTYTPGTTTPSAVDVFTYQFGDDVTTDWFQFLDGIMTGLAINSPETGAGVLTATETWRFGGVRSTGSTDSPVSGTVPTTGLSVDIDGTPIYLKDCSIFIDSTAAGLGTTQITDALHNFTFTITEELDEKRFANGDQSFDVDAYGRGAYNVSLACQFAKTADTVGTGSESDSWMSDTAVNRFVRLMFTSTREAATGVPYSWELDLPLRYYTRAEGAIGGNTTVTLTGNAFLESATLAYAFKTIVVNTLASTGI